MKVPCISTSAAVLLLAGHVRAGVLGSAPDPSPSAEELQEMLKTFQEQGQGLFPDNPLDEYPRGPVFEKTCLVSMETTHGLHCYADVVCRKGGLKEYNPKQAGWNACFGPDPKTGRPAGRQFFHDPRIGDFSITFAQRDGFEQGQGLTTPILQVKEIGNFTKENESQWLKIPVEGVAREGRKQLKCKKNGHHSPEYDCGQGPMPCSRGVYNDEVPFARQATKKWVCAIPYRPGY